MPHTESPAEARYARYVLVVLFGVSVFNFIDRQILSTLIEPIKREFGVSDTAMGFLTGPAFALFYTFAGVPIARFADVGSRPTIVAAGVAVWSAMTAVSGLAQNFVQLALIRVGVGVGEAAGTPPSHAMISDYFPPEKRGRALAVYGIGIHVGILFGFLAGGWINEWFGWRAAFFVVGLPGLALALLVKLTVRDPPRGQFDVSAPAPQPPLLESFRLLGELRSYWLLVTGLSLASLAGYGYASWSFTFLIRVHDLGYGEAATGVAIATVVGGASGTYVGGALADRWGLRDVRWYAWIPALSLLLTAPAALPFLLLPDATHALVAYIPFLFLGAMYSSPTWAMVQALAPARLRATATSILMLVGNAVGIGAGPLIVGAANDWLAPSYGEEAVRYTLLAILGAFVASAAVYALSANRLRRELEAATAARAPGSKDV